MKILIADDEAVSRRRLEFVLTRSGFYVESATAGDQALDILMRESAPPLAILDVMMPGLTGVEICRRLRRTSESNPPYIILLTIRSTKQDIVEGLDAGANDYVIKPFDPDELLARVRVGLQMLHLQRKLSDRVRELEDALSRVRHLQGLLRNDTHVYEFGPYRLEAAERRLTRRGQPVPLTAKVFDLLLLLIQNSGHLLEKEEIMREVWRGSEVEDNNLTVSMSVLRKALAEGGCEDYIETVPKRGYRFVAAVERRG